MTNRSDNYEAFSELYPLVIASLSGEITPAQVAQLDELVCSDPQARRLYAQLICESVNLRTWAELAQEEATEEATEETTEETTDEATMPGSVARPRRPSRARRWTSAVAAASLAACLLVGWIFMGSTEKEPPLLSNQELELETMAVVEEAQSVLDLLDELERENDTIVRLLDQDVGAEPQRNNEVEEPA
jgi:hypothetical protein